MKRPARPILGMPVIGGHISLTADVIKRKPRAVLISNDTTQVWIPTSQLVRVSGTQVIVTEWIVRQKIGISLLENKSPEYAEWLVKSKAESENVRQWIRETGGFQCKFGDGDD